MIQVKELQAAVYNLTITTIEKSVDFKNVGRALSLLEKVSRLDKKSKCKLSISEDQKNELQDKLYTKAIVAIGEASNEVTFDALREVDEILTLIQRTI